MDVPMWHPRCGCRLQSLPLQKRTRREIERAIREVSHIPPKEGVIVANVITSLEMLKGKLSDKKLSKLMYVLKELGLILQLPSTPFPGDNLNI